MAPITMTNDSAVSDSSNSGEKRATIEDARRHHGGGVDQGGNRRRAFHRIRQPGMQWHLGRLAHRADEQADAGDRQQHPVGARQGFAGQLVGLGEHVGVMHGAGVREQRADAQHEAEVADPVDQERLHVGEDRGRAGVPEADQRWDTRPTASQPKNSCTMLFDITSISMENVNSEM